MARDPRYDILFEPLRIGPVTTKNRFFQVPHCTGMGYLRPRMLAELRAMKAEGGWGVVCTDRLCGTFEIERFGIPTTANNEHPQSCCTIAFAF